MLFCEVFDTHYKFSEIMSEVKKVDILGLPRYNDIFGYLKVISSYREFP